MTRFEALNVAIRIVKKSDHPKKTTIVEKLEQCVRSVQNRKWNEENIHAYCRKVVEEKGRLLTSDFDHPGTPTHGDIACVFKMTAREFRDAYYPLKSPLSPLSMYFRHTAEEWTALFLEDYHRIKPKTQSEYNRLRAEGLPRWNAVARMNGVSSWIDLLVKLGLRRPLYGEIKVVESTYPSLQAIIDFEAELEAKAAVGEP